MARTDKQRCERNIRLIEFLKEKHLQEVTFPFNNSSGIQVTNENEVSIRDIYNNDMVFNKISFEKLTQEQKQIMCNKYFREVVKEKILSYFTELNKEESTKQTIKGIYTNGIVRSVKYAAKKVLKKILVASYQMKVLLAKERIKKLRYPLKG